jgi:hypothetical protein
VREDKREVNAVSKQKAIPLGPRYPDARPYVLVRDSRLSQAQRAARRSAAQEGDEFSRVEQGKEGKPDKGPRTWRSVHLDSPSPPPEPALPSRHRRSLRPSTSTQFDAMPSTAAPLVMSTTASTRTPLLQPASQKRSHPSSSTTTASLDRIKPPTAPSTRRFVSWHAKASVFISPIVLLDSQTSSAKSDPLSAFPSESIANPPHQLNPKLPATSGASRLLALAQNQKPRSRQLGVASSSSSEAIFEAIDSLLDASSDSCLPLDGIMTTSTSSRASCA